MLYINWSNWIIWFQVSGFGCQYTDDGEQKTAIVVVLVPYKILIHEDEYEKNPIRSHASALRLFLFSAFRIPTSEFLTPYTM
jgi:hypothetical protein